MPRLLCVARLSNPLLLTVCCARLQSTAIGAAREALTADLGAALAELRRSHATPTDAALRAPAAAYVAAVVRAEAAVVALEATVGARVDAAEAARGTLTAALERDNEKWAGPRRAAHVRHCCIELPLLLGCSAVRSVCLCAAYASEGFSSLLRHHKPRAGVAAPQVQGQASGCKDACARGPV